MIREWMVSEAQLALAAYRTGNMVGYQVHQTNARLLADHLAMQEARQKAQRRPPQFRPDFGIEGPDHPHDDFLKQDNALSGLARYVIRPSPSARCSAPLRTSSAAPSACSDHHPGDPHVNAPVHHEEGTALAVTTSASASAGALLLHDASMDRLERIADLMANGKTTVPAHLRGSKGDCFAIALQSMQWGMNPFAVAQKTHLVNGVLGYEAQLVAAVINTSGAVRDRFHFEWFGPWEKVVGKFQIRKGEKGEYRVPGWTMEDEAGCGIKVWATLKGENEPRVLELLLAQARVRNSTLWADDPKQQLAYLAQKRWSRLYAPDVILGVYTADEVAEPGEKFMGMAEVVSAGTSSGTGAATAAEVVHTPWPADLFAQRLPEWRKAIAANKATADSIVSKALTKHPLTPEQEAAIRAPVFTYAQVADRLNAAKDMEQLAEAASVIAAVPDEQHRTELSALYDKRAAELSA